MSYLSSISPLESSDNLGGLKYIRVIRAADVATDPESFEGVATSEIVFQAGRDWIDWAATYLTSSFSSRGEDSPEGMADVKELPFIIARHSKSISMMLRKAEKDEFIVLFEDFNGVRWIFGTKAKPVRFAFDQETGVGRDRNQYVCRFYSDSPGNLLLYPAELGAGETDFSSCPPIIIRRGASDGPILAVAPAGSTVVINSPYSFGYYIIAS